MMKIVCISDTHNKLGDMSIPDGDILIHAGDLTVSGTMSEIRSGLNDLSDLPHKYKILVAGNHDRLFESYSNLTRSLFTEFPDIIYVQDELINVEGITLYGTPWTPEFNKFAFMHPRNSEELERKFKNIPFGVNILVTHGPPQGILDKNYQGINCGCEILAREVKRVAPRLHVFGHIHESSGVHKVDNTLYVNSSMLTREYRIRSKNAYVVEFNRKALYLSDK